MRGNSQKLLLSTLGALLTAVGSTVIAASPPGSATSFDENIRPALAEHCYKCHSAKAVKLKGGLHLDHRET